MTFPEFTESSHIWTEEEKRQAYAEIAAQDEFDRKAYHELQWLKLCPKIYNQTIDYAKIEPGNHAVVKSIIEWKRYPKGLFIIGPTGRAKTRACWTALKTQWLANKSIHHATSFQVAQDAVKSVTDHDEGRKVIKRYVNSDILFIDDIGKRLTPVTCQFLFEVLERRTSNELPIIATSNETPATLAQAINDSTMAEPIIRRIREFCDMVVLP